MALLEIISKPEKTVETSAKSLSPMQPVSDALSRIFVSDQEQSRIQKIRNIMGDLVMCLADEELEAYMAEFQYLIDEWLDDFERQTFDGQTLGQMLGRE